MRLVILVMMFMVIMIPQVQAVGIGTVDDYSGGFELDVGDDRSLEFSLRGDNVVNDVTFFITAGGGVEFDNKVLYEDAFHLDAYENEDIVVNMVAITGGIWTVEWGYRQNADGSGFGIDSVMKDFFTVEITDDGSGDDFDITVGGGSLSSGSSSGGGGGGGSFNDADGDGFIDEGFLPSTPLTDVTDVETGEVIAQDVSAQGSAVNELVVNDELSGSATPLLSVSADEGKLVLLMVLFLGLVTMLFTFSAARNVHREGL